MTPSGSISKVGDTDRPVASPEGVKAETFSVRFSLRSVRSTTPGVSDGDVQRRVKAGDEASVIVAGGGGGKPVRLGRVWLPNRESQALGEVSSEHVVTPASTASVITAQGPDGTSGFFRVRTRE
jgi:hypothetical protein